MVLKEIILEAEEKGVAVGHFNIANLDMFWGIVDATLEVSSEARQKVPVIIGLSEGEREAMDARTAATLVQSVREEFEHPIFINADHSHSLETFKEAIDAGYDMAIIDAADKELTQNIEISLAAREYRDHRESHTLVEGEIGYIGTSSKLIDDIPEGAALGELLPSADLAREYVEKTGVDLLAPAVGNIHGMLKNRKNPDLNIEHIREIKVAVGVPLVLHGGSGVSDMDFVNAIDAGISVIHISTELRVAYRKALENSLALDRDELSPYKYVAPARDSVKECVKERLRLFNKIR